MVGLHVRGGKAEGPASAGAPHDLALHRVQASEQPRRALDVAGLEGRPDLRRGDRDSIHHEGGHHVGAEAEPDAQRLEQLRVAARAAAEAVVEADHDGARLEPPDEHVAHERLGLHRRHVPREGHDDGRVDARLGDEREPLLEARQREGRPRGLEHLERVRVERTGERHEPVPPRLAHGGREDRAVAEMDAVEDAERDGALAGVRRVGLESPDDPHAESEPASPGARRPRGRPRRRARRRRRAHGRSGLQSPARVSPRRPARARTPSRFTRADSAWRSAVARSAQATASASVKGPTRARLRRSTAPPYPSAAPRSAARTRTYVPLPQTTRSVARGDATSSTAIERTNTSRGSRSTSMPWRANS